MPSQNSNTTFQSTQQSEIWKPVVGWETIYHVSNLGRIKRISKGDSPKSHTVVGRILNPISRPDGYTTSRFRYNGKSAFTLTHRIVAFAFLGDIPKGYEVNHKDGNRSNNVLSNLEIVTFRENKLHSYRVLNRTIVRAQGEKAGNVKLSNTKVLEIRRLYASGGITHKTLAKQFNVSLTLINHIINRRAWKHI